MQLSNINERLYYSSCPSPQHSIVQPHTHAGRARVASPRTNLIIIISTHLLRQLSPVREDLWADDSRHQAVSMRMRGLAAAVIYKQLTTLRIKKVIKGGAVCEVLRFKDFVNFIYVRNFYLTILHLLSINFYTGCHSSLRTTKPNLTVFDLTQP